MLLTIYLIYKYLGPEWIDWLLRIYFFLAALLSVPRFIISLSRLLLGTTLWKQFDKVIFSIKKGSKGTVDTISWFLNGLTFLFVVERIRPPLFAHTFIILDTSRQPTSHIIYLLACWSQVHNSPQLDLLILFTYCAMPHKVGFISNRLRTLVRFVRIRHLVWPTLFNPKVWN
jgi:hypothetical protein